MAVKIDRESLVSRLTPIEYKPEANAEQGHLEQMSLSGVLLVLGQIDHEREYELCRAAALHLLGEIHELEDINID